MICYNFLQLYKNLHPFFILIIMTLMYVNKISSFKNMYNMDGDVCVVVLTETFKMTLLFHWHFVTITLYFLWRSLVFAFVALWK